jgi:hypothetical protein
MGATPADDRIIGPSFKAIVPLTQRLRLWLKTATISSRFPAGIQRCTLLLLLLGIYKVRNENTLM